MLDLYTGDLPADLIPDFTFPAFTWEEIRKESTKVLPTGYEPLQEILLQHLADSFNLPTNGQKLVITAGSTQGITLLMQVLLHAGIASRQRTLLSCSLPLFSTMNVQLIGIKQDSEGIRPAALEKVLKEKKIKFVYLNPTFQNPTGHTMSDHRRQAIIRLCQTYQVPIIEDDVFSELAFDKVPPKLKSMAPETVIYLGSLSKLLGSSIKIGWLLVPEALADQFAQAKNGWRSIPRSSRKSLPTSPYAPLITTSNSGHCLQKWPSVSKTYSNSCRHSRRIGNGSRRKVVFTCG